MFNSDSRIVKYIIFFWAINMHGQHIANHNNKNMNAICGSIVAVRKAGKSKILFPGCSGNYIIITLKQLVEGENRSSA